MRSFFLTSELERLKMERYTNIGNAITELMNQAGVCDSELAERMNKSVYFVEGLMSGDFVPSEELLKEVSDAISLGTGGVELIIDDPCDSEKVEPTHFRRVMQVLSSGTTQSMDEAFERFSDSVGYMHSSAR